MHPSSTGNSRRGLFGALQSLVSGAAVLLDDSHGLQYANKQACDLFDCPDEAALRAQWPRIAVTFALAPGTSPPAAIHSSHARYASGDGPRTLTLELRALDPEVGAGFFGLLVNSGQLDPLERDLLQASEQRAWTYQRETLMHDLKGILNAMQISLELISDPDPQPLSPADERKQRRIEALKQDLMRVDRGLKMLPGADGHGEPPVTQVDVSQLVKEVFTALRQLIRRNQVSLTLELAEGPVMASGRQAWIRQALFSIAVHRLNAMRAGGPLAVQAVADDQGALIRFHDGVPHGSDQIVEESRRLVAPAHTHGAASDLRVARAVVESTGGTLEIGASESTGAAAGTTIIVRLPR